MRFPVKKIVKPKDLTGQENGKINARLLRSIAPSGQLHHKAAKSWNAMCKAAKSDSVNLVHVGAYRTYAKQLQMFQLRYSKKRTGRIPQVTRIWNGATWYLKKGMSPSASPGKSNHGLGLSIDAALKIGQKTVPVSADPDGKGPLKSGTQWLHKHAVSFGWCWEISNPSDPNFEAWHLVFFAGDEIPPAVLAQQPKTLTTMEGQPT